MQTVQQLIDKYYTSNDFKMLRDRTKKDYQYFLGVMCDSFGDVNFDNLTSKQAKHAYEEWVARGISLANHVCTVSSIVYRYATETHCMQCQGTDAHHPQTTQLFVVVQSYV